MKFFNAIVAVVTFTLLVSQQVTAAPIPRPIEDLYPSQIPDAGAIQAFAADSSVSATFLASQFDPNDTSALHGGP